ncbi:MAG: outer membrane beta-barrel protein [Ignavibacteria bacterium]|jgi:hypothetical protein
MFKKLVFSIVLLLVFTSNHAFAKDSFSSSSIEVRALFLHHSKSETLVNINGSNIDVKNNGFGGVIEYSYHFDDIWAFFFNAGGVAAKVEASIDHGDVSSEVSTVTPILMGAKLYLNNYSNEIPIKPFIKAGLGIYMGNESKSEVITVENHTESAVGAYVGGGVDFLLLPFLKATMQAGYNTITDFDRSIGGRLNYTGPEVSLGFGFLF